jgi:hypothetical protein
MALEAPMAITPSRLRQNVYRILDEAIETGQPVEVVRKGRVLKIVPPPRTEDKLASLKRRPGAIVGNPDDLVHMDWSRYWDPDQNLNP